ncbi:hypothetical protein AVEN_220868-1 [Araneus ventricosus]|uniref:Uncharacterized protein n=1 Tax=Araneus ventricosus TaxID=182803 RepID=A0A4Y2L1C3_ARAVE|nr:hypothetical protein AVEN_220868-1 [Araneus ventricosus]
MFFSSKDKELIAAKIPFDTILDEIRDGVSDSRLERIHLLTKKDIYNIEKMYNLQSSGQRHINDAVIVDAWVREMQNSDKDNCVLYYKLQSSDEGFLKDEDFVLIIMTDAQSEIFKKFSSDVVCMDGTHGLNSYSFEV